MPAWPTAPPPPSTSTRSPGCSRARQLSAIQAATPDSPKAAAISSGTSASIGTTSVSGTAHRSASAPSPGFMPAVAKNHTRVPASNESEDSTTPTP